jgi:hypothetical protein
MLVAVTFDEVAAYCAAHSLKFVTGTCTFWSTSAVDEAPKKMVREGCEFIQF